MRKELKLWACNLCTFGPPIDFADVFDCDICHLGKKHKQGSPNLTSSFKGESLISRCLYGFIWIKFGPGHDCGGRTDEASWEHQLILCCYNQSTKL